MMKSSIKSLFNIFCFSFLRSLILPAILTIACTSSEQNHSQITYPVSQMDFVITVDGDGELEAVKSHMLVVPRVRAQPKISYLIPEGTAVLKGDIVVQLEAETIESDYRNALDEVEIAKADAHKKEAELTLKRLLQESQLKIAQASLKTSRLHLDKLKFEAPTTREIKKLEIKKIELETKVSRDKIKALEKIKIEELAHMLLKIKQAQIKLQRSKSQLDLLDLKAPVDGLVVYERSWITGNKVQEGDAIYPNMPVVKIPDMSSLQVNLKISENDAQKVKVGQNATVFVPVLGDLILTGKVSRVGRMAKPIKRGSKVKKVDVIVTIDSTFQKLVPGLSATCRIQIEKIPGAIFLPKECLFEKDSVKIVYVFKKGSFHPCPVAVSQQDEDFVIIKGDLSIGDLCALRQPNNSQVKWPDELKPYTSVTDSSSTLMDNLN